jgi:hypothetical protein
MTESEKEKLIRQYAAGDITWSALRGRGFENFVDGAVRTRQAWASSTDCPNGGAER